MNALPGLPANLCLLERGWLSSNNILLIGPDDTALVDSGYSAHAPQTVALLEAALAGRQLDLLLNTHLHSDHCGGNAALQRNFPRMHTWIPPGDAALVSAWDEDALSYRATGQECPRFGFQGLLAPGTLQRLGGIAWEVHAAPGHDPNSVILFEPISRTLLSADALWEKGFGVVFPELIGEASFDEVAATLDLIEGLAPLILIPGHGPAFGNLDAALGVARQRLARQVADPKKHARHALKVLIKFKLMAAQEMTDGALCAWLATAPYFELIRARFLPTETLVTIIQELIAELVASGAAMQCEGRISDR